MVCGDAARSMRETAHGWRKPEWVHREVLRLAVFLKSCRAVAEAFNRIHGHDMTVSRGFVNNVCRANRELLTYRRRAMRGRPPWPVPRNEIWAMDLTQLPAANDEKITALGLIDHGTRRELCLQVVMRKCTWTLLGHLCLAIAKHGKPRVIKTDNEAMFTGRLWKLALRWASIRHRRSRPWQPWENGRIERFFGTLKSAVHGRVFPSRVVAQQVLDEFSDFYNHARPHQNLGGLTPIEAWNGQTRKDVMRRTGCGQWVQALGGRLVAYHLRV